MKKLKIIAGILILIVLLAVGAFILRHHQMSSMISTEYSKIEDVDLSKAADGTYFGTF